MDLLPQTVKTVTTTTNFKKKTSPQISIGIPKILRILITRYISDNNSKEPSPNDSKEFVVPTVLEPLKTDKKSKKSGGLVESVDFAVRNWNAEFQSILRMEDIPKKYELLSNLGRGKKSTKVKQKNSSQFF